MTKSIWFFSWINCDLKKTFLLRQKNDLSLIVFDRIQIIFKTISLLGNDDCKYDVMSVAWNEANDNLSSDGKCLTMLLNCINIS